jgi:predicted MPP superfamily phosphohydrolase
MPLNAKRLDLSLTGGSEGQEPLPPGSSQQSGSRQGRSGVGRAGPTLGNILRTGVLAALPICAALIVAMVVASSAIPIERRVHVHAQPWPKGTVMRIVLLSDLHVSVPGDSPARLRQTIVRVNATRPDLVLIAGDFTSNAMAVRRASLLEATAPLAGLRARNGVVAVLGNNDADLRDRLVARLQALGITVLENRAVRYGPLAVIGLDDHSTRHLDVSVALSSYRRTGGWPLFLAHSPYSVWSLPAGGGLILAGHTHCGQILLPIISDLVTPASLRRYDCGIVRDGGRLTIISAGLGVSILPLRLGAPPDYWVIDIGNP